MPDKRIPPQFLLKVFDASGQQILATELEGHNGRYESAFDELRLRAGDYTFAIFAASVRAFGSYENEHTGLFSQGILPPSPQVDELAVLPPSTDNLTPSAAYHGVHAAPQA